MLCPGCGQENPIEATFCMACATSLVPSPEPALLSPHSNAASSVFVGRQREMGELREALDDAMTQDLDCTGAMHHGALSMLIKIHEDGYDAFIQRAEAEVPDRVSETTIDQITAEVDAADAEWRAKLATGHDPMKELLDEIGPENIIHLDPEDPQSMTDAAAEIKKRIEGIS